MLMSTGRPIVCSISMHAPAVLRVVSSVCGRRAGSCESPSLLLSSQHAAPTGDSTPTRTCDKPCIPEHPCGDEHQSDQASFTVKRSVHEVLVFISVIASLARGYVPEQVFIEARFIKYTSKPHLICALDIHKCLCVCT